MRQCVTYSGAENGHRVAIGTAFWSWLRCLQWHYHVLNHVRNALQHTATHCNALQHTATHCNTLQNVTFCWLILAAMHSMNLSYPQKHAATHCNTLQHNATHCVLQCVAMHCGATCCNAFNGSIMSLTTCATRCNTLQHNATHCNTLQNMIIAAISSIALSCLWHCALCFSMKHLCRVPNEPCILWKEPYVLSKEPCILSK